MRARLAERFDQRMVVEGMNQSADLVWIRFGQQIEIGEPQAVCDAFYAARSVSAGTFDVSIFVNNSFSSSRLSRPGEFAGSRFMAAASLSPGVIRRCSNPGTLRLALANQNVRSQ